MRDAEVSGYFALSSVGHVSAVAVCLYPLKVAQKVSAHATVFSGP